MVDDDVLYGFRLRLLDLARELGDVGEACRLFGVHRSTYYRWKRAAERSGIEMLRPRERRPPRMPNSSFGCMVTNNAPATFSLSSVSAADASPRTVDRMGYGHCAPTPPRNGARTGRGAA